MSDVLVRGKFPSPPEPQAVSADWARRGYSCEEFVDPPGRRWNDFVHDCNEVVTVVEGRLRLRLGETDCIVEPGDEVFIAKGEVHSVHNIHHGVTRWLYGYD